MGRFVNPDSSAFQVALNSRIYVDKTGLIEYTNSVLDTTNAYICNSRPRRFGKSYAANMLSAYYSKGADSGKMFSGLKISKDVDFKKHLNKYDVIHIDIQWFLANCENTGKVVSFITKSVLDELREIYPEVLPQEIATLPDALSRVKDRTGQKFVVIIDEWDVIIRDGVMTEGIQDEYLSFLRGMFKGTEPTKYIQLAYLTGILPIKKIKTQSALNNFDEFTMLDAGRLAPYIGFTETEVKQLLPIQRPELPKHPADVYHEEFMLLPSPEVAVDTIVPNYLTGFVYGALVEAFCSEQNDRMLSMEAANGNADALLHDLGILYNRARQAAITQEITEVSSGARAQRRKRLAAGRKKKRR